MNPSNIHRVHGGNLLQKLLNAKTLRIFDHEMPQDCQLRVTDIDRDGRFVLWADYGPLPPSAHNSESKRIQIEPGGDILDQSTVDKIEAASELAPDSPQLADCDFVVFEQSPLARRECTAKGQRNTRTAD